MKSALAARLKSVSPTSYGTVKPRALASVDERSDGGEDDVGYVHSDIESVSTDYGYDLGYDEVDLRHTSYRSLILHYTTVPLSAFLFLLALILLPRAVWPRPVHTPHYGDLLAAAGAWIVSFSLRTPTHLISTFLPLRPSFQIFISTVAQVLIQDVIRLSLFALLGLTLEQGNGEWVPYPEPEDDAFRRVWWMATGWAAVETLVAVCQAYGQLALYKDWLNGRTGTVTPTPANTPAAQSYPPMNGEMDAERQSLNGPRDLDEEVQRWITLKERAEVEEVYGVPLPIIPTFISCLQRIDSILLSFALTLLLSSAYVRGVAATSPSQGHDLMSSSSIITPTPQGDIVKQALIHALPYLGLVVAVHSVLALLWTLWLPRIGVHVASYAALLVALSLFFGGLASWGVLD